MRRAAFVVLLILTGCSDREGVVPIAVDLSSLPDASAGVTVDQDATLAPVPAPAAPPPLSASFGAVLDDGTVIPPSPTGAAGPSHLVAVTNSRIRVQDRDGVVLSDVALDDFFASAGAPDAFDPHIHYDRRSDRWVLIASANPGSSNSRILIAASQTGDPRASWWIYSQDPDVGSSVILWADTPYVGGNKDYLIIQADLNQLNGSFGSSRAWLVPRSLIYAGSPASSFFSWTLASAYGHPQVPAMVLDTMGTSVPLISNYLGNYEVTNTNTNLTTHYSYLAIQTVQLSGITLGPVQFVSWVNESPWEDEAQPESAPQLGDTRRIALGDSRFRSAVARGNQFWAAQHVFLPPSAPERSAVQWFRFTSGGANVWNVAERGRIDDPGTPAHFAFPSLAVNSAGDLAIGYSRFSADTFPSAGYSFRFASDPPSFLRTPALLKSGEAPYDKDYGASLNRWGERTATVVDVDGGGFWTIQQYAASPANTWGTWWGQIGGPNRAPTIDAIADVAYPQDPGAQTITLTGLGPGAPAESWQTLTITASSEQPSKIPNPAAGAITGTTAPLSFTPSASAVGAVEITVTVQDDGGTAGGGRDTTVRTFVVTLGSNGAPSAVDDAYAVAEDSTLMVAAAQGVLANDSDPNADPIDAALVSAPANGTVELAADGSLTYVPAANFSGSDSFVYRASDGAASTNATVTVTVTQGNDAPVAVGNSFAASEDTTLSVSSPGVLAGDTDPEGDPITALLATQAAHGVVTLQSNGAFSYVPDANWFGGDSFTYRASDGQLQSSPASVILSIAGAPDAPNASADSYSTAEETLLNVTSASGVTANDSDPDGPSSLTVTKLSDPQYGTLALNANGSFTYQPSANFAGVDSFTYEISDGALTSAPATVTITVNGVNDAPQVVADAFDANEDEPLVLDAASGLLANDVDPDSASLTALIVQTPLHGELVAGDDGSFTFTPDPNFNGIDTFAYRASDGTAQSAVGSVTVTVLAVNDAPEAPSQTQPADGSRVAPGDVRFRWTDPDDVDGDDLSFRLELTDPVGAITQQDVATVEVETPLTDGTWSWRVAAMDSAGAITWSGSRAVLVAAVDPDVGGCGCRTTPRAPGGGTIASFLAVVALLLMRRR